MRSTAIVLTKSGTDRHDDHISPLYRAKNGDEPFRPTNTNNSESGSHDGSCTSSLLSISLQYRLVLTINVGCQCQRNELFQCS